jgi:DNA-binding NarL/FixJ family response regulator
MLLEKVSDIQIVAEAGDGKEALRLIEQYQPDVALIDITMPKPDGFAVTEHVTREFPSVRVVILTEHAEEEYVRRAFQAGASGYLTKSVGSGELELAIKTVANGKTYLSPPFAIAELLSAKHTPLPQRLTPRQGEVLRLIAQGQSTKGIALSLNVSVKTVETHRAQLMERLGIHDTAGLVRYAIKTGIIRLND